jgi:hypothetical protein
MRRREAAAVIRSVGWTRAEGGRDRSSKGPRYQPPCPSGCNVSNHDERASPEALDDLVVFIVVVEVIGVADRERNQVGRVNETEETIAVAAAHDEVRVGERDRQPPAVLRDVGGIYPTRGFVGEPGGTGTAR